MYLAYAVVIHKKLYHFQGTMEEKVYDRQVAKQSMSNRVVDEQQVHRHFSSNDLVELYSFTPPSKIEDRPIPGLPKDVLLAEILTQFKEWIEKYHEHDSLLENVEAEELNEEERKLAWEDFENDKKRSLMPNTGICYVLCNIFKTLRRNNVGHCLLFCTNNVSLFYFSLIKRGVEAFVC